MKTRITAGTIAAFACSGVVALALPQAPPSAASSPKAEERATVVGCVEPGFGPSSFVLASRGTGEAGAKAAPGGVADKAARYELTADAGTDLSKLVGHRVEAVGTVSRMLSAPGALEPSAKAPMLKLAATSVREMAPTCS